MIGNAECGQAKTSRCDTRHSPAVARAASIVAGAFENLASLRACLLPKEQATLPLKIAQKGFVLLRSLRGVVREEKACARQRTARRGCRRAEYLAPSHPTAFALVEHRCSSLSGLPV